MPYNLTNREANPIKLEEFDILGQYIQGGLDPVDWYNNKTKSVLPGEPIIFCNQIMISKTIIYPGTFGSLVAGAWMRFLLDPAYATTVVQGTAIYFDTDLKVDGSYISGYATSVQPTNGLLLGRAIAPHAKGAEIVKSGGNAVAAKAGWKYVDVLMTLLAPTTYGTGSGL